MSDETRQKILNVASELFARYGFNGTSVRDIASACDVNVAAVNYHFGSKHNLYWAVVQESRNVAERGLAEIAKHVDNIEDLVEKAFDFFMSNQEGVLTAMRIMLTTGVPEPEGELKKAIEEAMGPPGATYMVDVLRKQVGESVPEEKILFAVNCIFGNLVHRAMINCCPKIEMIRKGRPDLHPDAIKRELRLHASILRDAIKST